MLSLCGSDQRIWRLEGIENFRLVKSFTWLANAIALAAQNLDETETFCDRSYMGRSSMHWESVCGFRVYVTGCQGYTSAKLGYSGQHLILLLYDVIGNEINLAVAEWLVTRWRRIRHETRLLCDHLYMDPISKVHHDLLGPVAMKNQPQSKIIKEIIKDNSIGKALNDLHTCFMSLCEDRSLSCTSDALDQLGQEGKIFQHC